jgi:hypothetical protein
MNDALHFLKKTVVKLLDWDFLIAMLPMIFYGLGFAAHANEKSSTYWVEHCISAQDRAFPRDVGNTLLKESGYLEMTNSMDVFSFMLVCCCCIYLVLKGRRFLTEFISFKDKFFYMQLAKIAVAIPSILISSMLILWFVLPHEGL